MLPRLLVLAGFWLAASGSSVLGCATCFGASDSKMAEGMNSGIITLLAVVAGVLGAILSAGLVLVTRARRVGGEPGVEPEGSSIEVLR